MSFLNRSPRRARRAPAGPVAARAGSVAVAALAAGAMLAASGCSGNANAGAGKGPAQAASPTRPPAALAGGACQLLDYDIVESELGVRFALAAAAVNAATFTCVLQPAGADEPDLTLAVTATLADESVFRASVVPKGATVLSNVGKIGYQTGVPAAAGVGPGLEIGWLSANQRLMVLRYHAAEGTAAADVNALLPKLGELARKIDLTTV
jgi:hypothetical protein